MSVKTIHAVYTVDDYGDYTRLYSKHRTKNAALKSLNEARNCGMDATYIGYVK